MVLHESVPLRQLHETLLLAFLALLLGAVGILRYGGGGAAPSDATRPNLIFVFSDQQSWDMLRCYGNAQVKTPNLDRLAAQGVRFNHCISNAPIGTPYRGLLLSGQH